MWNEIKPESEKQMYRKACAHFSYFPYLLNVTLLLLLLSAPLTSASATANVKFCEAYEGKIKLQPDVHLYILPSDKVTTVKFTSNCGHDYEVTFKQTDIKTGNHMTDSSGRLWTIVSYHVDVDVIHLKLGGHVYSYQDQNKCSSPVPLKVTFSLGKADVALDCSLLEPYQKKYRAHIIFIPIGAILVLLSVCCRCFYKRKNRRGITTVSVSANPIIISSVPSQPNPVPPPHLPPPPYSQLPPSNLPSSHLTPSQLPPSAVDSELPPPTSSKDTKFSRFKNQFAFKRLENDSS